MEGHLYGDRVWFYDTRSPVRRMGVSTHPIDATIVISLWQGDVCTGTFRLPARDAAPLISTLAYGMSEAIPRFGPGLGGRGAPAGAQVAIPRSVVGAPTARTETHLRLLSNDPRARPCTVSPWPGARR